ncbi:MAG: replication-associated recombination protein A [Candidatus Omnitrophica bacterium]|nr:replication-associated recombination protein A [Candidatus Omnitrophota bacterium]MCM8803449.1 replication-associated recombination protein A [Candidatus Omnitrophota bacterium]
MELFNSKIKKSFENLPLPIRVRPEKLEDFVGQTHLLGDGKPLRKIIESDRIPSMVFYGPPGCGKTALAMIIANITKKKFVSLNAVTSTTSDVRDVLKEARELLKLEGKGTILFLDEISHFNKLQQDALLKDVEEGTITLICATVHNPYFYINTPLLSRCLIFEFKPLSEEEIKKIIERVLKDKRGFGNYKIKITRDAIEYICKKSQGDARKALNTLEFCVLTTEKGKDGYILVDQNKIKDVLDKYFIYDRKEDIHYDTISAFIKSMRGSDPDSALYYLAKMILSGEDPRFIARRMLIFASEDIGNADPHALILANACYQAVEVVGMPEAKIILAQVVIYLSTCPKCNSSYIAIENAIKEIKNERMEEVPDHLKGTGYKGAEELGRGIGYKYPHDFEGHYVVQKYRKSEKKFYFPLEIGYESRIKKFLEEIERIKNESKENRDKTENKENKGTT